MKWWVTGVFATTVLLGSGLALADRDDHGHPEGRGPGPGVGAHAQAGFRGPAERDGRGMVLDNRYNHGQYYPPRGYVYRTLPSGYRPYYWGGQRFYFNAGVWYAPGPAGFIVTRPPIGLTISVLPPYYSTLWFGGVPYYYADDVYYVWRPAVNAYVVSDPPPDADNPGGVAPPPADDFFVYPKNGQSQEQQSADRYECHSWAKNQTGFDPTEPGGGVTAGQNGDRRADYRRAMTACLEARGYSVK
jgi:hypothetical protein